ncbi:MAG: hypothetical protein BGO26_09950 [Actinobacteria bacterium 69-20]|jgi:predicted transcriptional regulator|nr:hypothetical protein [Actinomycetota bacterium]OJV23229.1 MAG: hypothetical protein BGO26_09950 [Actinobacteria bacterium 69-20]
MSVTTIRVPTELRERVRWHASREHVSQATVLERALDLLDRESFFAQLRRDVAGSPESAVDVHERDLWLSGPMLAAEE